MPRADSISVRAKRKRQAADGKERPPRSLSQVRHQAESCTRCPLYRHATQTVFGEGPVSAELMLVGEEPGDHEDIEGHPFVGPAGRVLDKALKEAGLDRGKVFLTNAVKHFKFAQRGKRRLHKRPDAGEIDACRWWLDLELKFVDPAVVVTLGTTALRGVLGKSTPISRLRGSVVEIDGGRDLVASVHPSLILRLKSDRKRSESEYAGLVRDLKLARKAAAKA